MRANAVKRVQHENDVHAKKTCLKHATYAQLQKSLSSELHKLNRFGSSFARKKRNPC